MAIKTFYQEYRNHIWLSILTLLYSIIYSIIIFNNQVPFNWGVGMFIFGIVLLATGSLCSPIGKSEICLRRYIKTWRICIIVSMILMMFWGLYIPHKAKALIIIVGVISWLVVIYLMGIFHIGTNEILYDTKQEETWKGAENFRLLSFITKKI